MSTTVETGIDIRPFHVEFSDEKLDDLRRRIAETRWPGKELVDDPSQGVQLRMLQELARYWTTEYDWRKTEAKLNALPQFTTETVEPDPTANDGTSRFAAEVRRGVARSVLRFEGDTLTACSTRRRCCCRAGCGSRRWSDGLRSGSHGAT